MNRIHHRHHVRRIAAVLGAFAASALALVTGATTALASPVPPPAGPAGLVPLPVRAQAIVAGGYARLADRAHRPRGRPRRRRPGRDPR
jgi:hypothetical protein